MSQIPTIKIDANFGSGSVTGVFQPSLPDDASNAISDGIRTGYLLSGAGDDAIGFLLGLVGEDESARKGFSLDPGGGEHTIELRAQVTSGHTTDNDGQTLQWGSSADPSAETEATATGADAVTKAQVFTNYMRVASGGTDSLSPARFQWGEYSPDGVLDDELQVLLEQPEFTRKGPDTYEMSTTLVETATLSGLLDGDKQTDG
jgi:hypothetical protein